ncbi:E3 ubiquitin-protein ligase CBL [Schistosoma japonicum]|uniref:E3 ubiquitin-protein ligase CBL n=2 Tax=Schistosoma japonicum TaxID=6182 RepID=A0A4Z2D9L0_SCHJA|nr:E3 ubiquitin-protein ligase [Schistosoma japonicum]KAH8868559.1 E3 ubiquitin-protein ligase [Schistosoma japonicum]KAH8868560.1 E3 ubiquitin-protein ligase [Schistosoma japonicum]TNN13186.1 E3 ubiquitin-protein ligase CBL [Schistosoma japonicum]TNN13187.1 E3 ubiquitin-protein ligase CBL [Schistosoma japonicum]
MVDKKCVDFCYKYLDKVVRLCQQPKLNLKASPPYILDTIPDIYEKLQGITAKYEENYDILSEIDYFQIYILTLIEKCKQTINLFKNSKEKIFDIDSDARFRLVKLSLVYSHLLNDLEALFPQNTFVPSFRITKPNAAHWWVTNFGDSVIVSWQLFKNSLIQTFRIDSDTQLLALQTTIDITCNNYVSIFEFDVFTRLFQPWNNILETWKALAILHPGYMAFMTYDQVKAVLKRYCSYPGPGTYIFRLSCTKLGQWAIGYITRELKILQTIIQNKSLTQALVDGEREGFYLYPNGKPSPTTLLYHLTHDLLQVHLQVTKEQYQVYCEMGSTFELCKICDENNKDTRLEPCGHLICKNCLLNCQSTVNGLTCPFCRLEIKDTEDIIVDPYKPSGDSGKLGHQTSESTAICQHTLFFNELTERGEDLPCSISALCNKKSRTSDSDFVKPPPIPPRNFCLTPSIDNAVIHEMKPQTSYYTAASSVNHGFAVSTLPSDIHEDSQITNPNLLVIDDTSLHTLSNCNDQRWLCTRKNNSLMPGQVSLEKDNENFNCGLDLYYAQLDLNKSDSDEELEVGLSCGGKATIQDQQDDNKQVTLHHESTDSNLICEYLSDGHNHTDTSIISSNATHCSLPERDARSVDENVKGLILLNPEMAEETAMLLLTLTENRLRMSHEIWKHFMPRT